MNQEIRNVVRHDKPIARQSQRGVSFVVPPVGGKLTKKNRLKPGLQTGWRQRLAALRCSFILPKPRQGIRVGDALQDGFHDQRMFIDQALA